MLQEHFGLQRRRSISRFCDLVQLKLRLERNGRSVRKALEEETRAAYQRRLKPGSNEIVGIALALEHTFLVLLSARVTDETTWENLHEVFKEVCDEDIEGPLSQVQFELT